MQQGVEEQVQQGLKSNWSNRTSRAKGDTGATGAPTGSGKLWVQLAAQL